ncbi:MAG: hypothetical protein RL094_737 [Candidatus Parcubacteria bacterium]|jgi:hypothetical protein
MSNVRSNYFISGILVLCFICIPQSIIAAELTFHEVQNVNANDPATIVEIRIDPQSKRLNVVDGEIQLSGAASDNVSVQIENGQSVLPMWPTPPQYDAEKRSISFAGGVPGGFDKEGLLFRLRLSPTVSGPLTLSYINGSAYLNDGKGTKEVVSSKSLDITIDKDKQNQQKQINTVPVNSSKNNYAIIISLVVVLLALILKYGLKKNDKK